MSTMSRLSRYRPYFFKLSLILTTLMLVLLPYFAFLSVWAGSAVHEYRLVQLWPEVLLAVIFCLTLLSLSLNGVKKYARDNKGLLIVVAAYIVLTVVFGLVAYHANAVNLAALAFALIINLRFIIFFITTHMLFSTYKTSVNWWRIIIVPAIPIVLFGLVQEYFLPPRFLEHFGYSMFTILPFQYVDNKPDYLRVQSFLRGANPFGAYLVLILSGLFYQLFITQKLKFRMLMGALTTVTLLAFFYTYSRSAWLGVIVSGLLLLFVMALRQPEYRRRWLIALGCVCVSTVILFGVAFARDKQAVQYAIFHTQSAAKPHATSNSVRASLMKEGLHKVKIDPFGTGPGTAGPASVRNTKQAALLPENYFLQIAIEVGLQGLALFLIINAIVGHRLWRRRANGLAVVLLTSLAGITLVNVVSHAWADDTLGLLWWGLAGIALGTYSVSDSSHRQSTHEQTEV